MGCAQSDDKRKSPATAGQSVVPTGEPVADAAPTIGTGKLHEQKELTPSLSPKAAAPASPRSAASSPASPRYPAGKGNLDKKQLESRQEGLASQHIGNEPSTLGTAFVKTKPNQSSSPAGRRQSTATSSRPRNAYEAMAREMNSTSSDTPTSSMSRRQSLSVRDPMADLSSFDKDALTAQVGSRGRRHSTLP
mmetsp:Transcript_87318/g.154776  ORF Transcript_87318/g.154776 Transcript_87318/m.154776 type:complete len:192 (-) Transcript_87318:440-1015(-)